MRRPYDAVKRGFDILGALTCLVVLAPVIAVVAVLVRARLGRPVLFRQQRPGRDGRVFTLHKFRSMAAAPAGDPEAPDEQRLTPFGRHLRSTSLDELPTFVDVLVGSMSFVGPRPLLVEYLPLYSPKQARRHEVRPGITGLAQVSGRNGLSWEEKFALDVEYVERYGLRLDVTILLRTILPVLRRSGVAAPGQATVGRFTGTSEDAEL